MVGFGSSLRMSRRRGWEDAYLDYHSLRLLLTQIETVYEEEDWKQSSAIDDNNNTNNTGGILQSSEDENDINSISIGASEEIDDMLLDDSSRSNNTGLKGLWYNAVRTTTAIVTGKRSSSYYYHKQKRRTRGRRRRYPRRITSFMNNNSDIEQNNNNGWVSNQDTDEYFDYSDQQLNTRGKRKKDIKDSHDRALDKGGWRENGVTDYRDELFLVSDEEAAYGYDDNDDESVWEDEDEEDSIRGDEEEQYYNKDGVEQFDGNLGSSNEENIEGGMDLKERSIIDEERSKKLTPGSEKSMGEDAMSCNSPSGRDRQKDGGDSLFESTLSAGLLHTPNSQSSPTNQRGHKVQFSDSPGVLETGYQGNSSGTGYETFATAAQRRGLDYSQNVGDSSNMMIAGSPSEKQGWLDFIPGLLSKGKQQQQQMNPENDPLLTLKRKESNQSLDNPSPITKMSTFSSMTEDISAPNQYTHFSETFHKSTKSNEMPDHLPLHQVVRQQSPSPPNLTDDALSVEDADGLKSPLPRTPSQSQFYTSNSNPDFTVPVQATALGSLSSMPETPVEPISHMTPSMTKVSDKLKDENDNTTQVSKLGFGVSLKMIPTESSQLLHPSSPSKTPPPNFGMSQFYSFQNNEDEYPSTPNNEEVDYPSSSYRSTLEQSEDYDGGGEGEGRESSNMINFYGGGSKDGYFSVRSPTKASRRNHQPSHQQDSKALETKRPSLNSVRKTSGGKFIIGFLFGSPDSRRQLIGGKKSSSSTSNYGLSSRSRSSSFKSVRTNRSSTSRQKRASKRKRAARIKLRNRRERIPEHLRRSHARAAAITERFRGLLRAEVEKVILFANSRLGELSDTIGSLRYSSYEDGQEEMRRTHPALADGGMHQLSSSDSDGGESGVISEDSSTSLMSEQGDLKGTRNIRKSDSSKDETKKQIMLRDRLRISRPMFVKADFLGEDFSLLSAVDEADAYTAVGVELLHLLKYICINIIAVRKICAKHDRLLSNRMLGGYYQRLSAEGNLKSGFGGTLSNQSGAGYATGVFDTKIQHIANSATMQTVSSSLAIALTDFEASQSRSALLGGLGFVKRDSGIADLPSPRHQSFTKSRLKEAGAYQISGHCFRGDDESTVASEEGQNNNDDNSTSSNTALTRLQFVVTSIYGLREAARFKTDQFEHHSSRLLMISIGHSIVGDGLDGYSSETLNFLCSYQPDAAYTLDMETVYASLIGQDKADGIGGVMVASLAAAATGYDLASNRTRFRRQVAACMSINPKATGDDNDGTSSTRDMAYQNILRLNAASMMLYLGNYYVAIPTAHIFAASLGSRSSTAALIGMANIGAIVSSFIHVVFTSKSKSFIRRRLDLGDFRLPLILSSLFAMSGNILYSYSLTKSSLMMALGGRFLIGLGCAEVLNKQLLSKAVPQETINTEGARLAKKSMITIPLSLLLGSLTDIAIDDDNIDDTNLTASEVDPPFDQQHRLFSLQSLGYFVSLLWFGLVVGLTLMYDIPKKRRRRPKSTQSDIQEEDFDSDSEDQGRNLSQTVPDEIGSDTFDKLQTMSRKPSRHGQSQHTYMESVTDIKRLLLSNVACPATIALLFIAKMTGEILLSSCGTIASRYFNWSGARSGLFMALITTTILPINLSLASQRNFTERGTMKVALEIARYGLIFMVNYESIIYFFISLVKGTLSNDSSTKIYYYDGIFGSAQYVLSFGTVFCSVVALQSLALSLMSKSQVCPRQMKKYTIDNAFITLLVSAVARLVGDALIVAFDASTWTLFNTDIINSLGFSMIIALSLGIYLLRKHYFFLI